MLYVVRVRAGRGALRACRRFVPQQKVPEIGRYRTYTVVGTPRGQSQQQASERTGAHPQCTKAGQAVRHKWQHKGREASAHAHSCECAAATSGCRQQATASAGAGRVLLCSPQQFDALTLSGARWPPARRACTSWAAGYWAPGSRCIGVESQGLWGCSAPHETSQLRVQQYKQGAARPTNHLGRWAGAQATGWRQQATTDLHSRLCRHREQQPPR